VRRSNNPINIDFDEFDSESGAGFLKQKPILEIVTKVSTNVVPQIGYHSHGRPYPPNYGLDGLEPDYNNYGHGDPGYYQPAVPNRPSKLKLVKTEATSMIINSPFLINALKSVVAYYPGIFKPLGDKVAHEYADLGSRY
jgi:hypothetical protein